MVLADISRVLQTLQEVSHEIYNWQDNLVCKCLLLAEICKKLKRLELFTGRILFIHWLFHYFQWISKTKLKNKSFQVLLFFFLLFFWMSQRRDSLVKNWNYTLDGFDRKKKQMKKSYTVTFCIVSPSLELLLVQMGGWQEVECQAEVLMIF